MARSPQPLAGKVALVTGANKGVGEAAALALADAGADVVVVGRTPGDLPGTVGAVVARIRALGRRAEGVVGDVRDEADGQRMFDRAVEVFGGVDVLVNNAGVYYLGKPLAELSLWEWDDMMEVNLRGVFLCCRAAVPIMAGRGGGSIIGLTSNAGEPHRDSSGMAGYAVTKAGLERLTQVLAFEVAGANIAVNALAPVGLRTPGSVAANPPDRVAGFHPAELIGPVVVHLAQCRAEFSGHTVKRTDFVDGRFLATR
jgi:NAD(P)-dependent dehydrogenase (short-subunit alcohol dehydrogenase family)